MVVKGYCSAEFLVPLLLPTWLICVHGGLSTNASGCLPSSYFCIDSGIIVYCFIKS